MKRWGVERQLHEDPGERVATIEALGACDLDTRARWPERAARQKKEQRDRRNHPS
jgi:hypothetical protein